MTQASFGKATAAMLVALMVAGCAGRQDPGRADVEIRGTDPSGSRTTATTAPRDPVLGANGIRSYDGYEAVVARPGDTVTSVAQRVGLSASELGAYNGLSPNQTLRPGDELVLPPRPGGYGGAPVMDSQAAATATAPAPLSSIESQPLGGGIDVTPSAGGTAGAVGGQAASSGWSPDVAAAAIERASGLGDDGSLNAPPSSDAPLPANPEPRPDLASPNLRQYQTPEPEARPGTALRQTERAAVEAERQADEQLARLDPDPAAATLNGMRLSRPVDGPVAVGYNVLGNGPRNEGVDFAAPAGARVTAAADGEVALVSQSLGGLGTIVLIRHQGDILTVYGRVDNVSVAKGDPVSRGQTIGVVAQAPQGQEGRMHFEVRRGAESLDPMRFL